MSMVQCTFSKISHSSHNFLFSVRLPFPLPCIKSTLHENSFHGGCPAIPITIFPGVLFCRIQLITVHDVEILFHVKAMGACIAVDLVAAVIHCKADKGVM